MPPDTPPNPPPLPESTPSGEGSRTSDRRAFLRRVSVGLAGAVLRPEALWARSQTAGRIVADEPWGRLLELEPGQWALVSRPDGDRLTLCNGGIIAGSDRVLMIDAYAGPEGAAWMAHQARALSGRPPTDVVVTHHHGDHTRGIAGFFQDGSSPRLWLTPTARDLILAQDRERGEEDPSRIRAFAAARLLDEGGPTVLDLGGREVRLVPTSGHTPSDVWVEAQGDRPVAWCGDLVWNGYFPNFVDARPQALMAAVRSLVGRNRGLYVTGHGELADHAAAAALLALLEDVEAAARRAFQAGLSPGEAARSYHLPGVFSEWILFNPRYFEIAFAAWYRELSDGPERESLATP